MPNNSKIAIVIPTHKSITEKHEIISYKRIIHVAKGYDIHLVVPKNVDVSSFRTIGPNIYINYLKQDFFGELWKYNKMLLSLEFYSLFKGYSNILIYHLDSFIIKPEFEYWVKQDYANIGPPFINAPYYSVQNIIKALPFFSKNFIKIKLIASRIFNTRSNYGSNGGFCLRNVDMTLEILRQYNRHVNNWRGHEDVFFSFFVPLIEVDYKVPDLKTSLKFGFDSYPDVCFKLNKNTLPFGCHSWHKYLEFWSPIIKQRLL